MTLRVVPEGVAGAAAAAEALTARLAAAQAAAAPVIAAAVAAADPVSLAPAAGLTGLSGPVPPPPQRSVPTLRHLR
ncbi:hypothetical protein LAUMK191_03161 [Mycobacterium attenuatum]|nr:PE domain-containing protein [Mycobacterium attenuatum]VBA54633.1 hypothetical protein LAUMK191_03161 [Mycobacterium attenuatum]